MTSSPMDLTSLVSAVTFADRDEDRDIRDEERQHRRSSQIQMTISFDDLLEENASLRNSISEIQQMLAVHEKNAASAKLASTTSDGTDLESTDTATATMESEDDVVSMLSERLQKAVMSKKKLMAELGSARSEARDRREMISSLEEKQKASEAQVLALRNEVLSVMPLKLKLQELRDKSSQLSIELTSKISELLVAQDSLSSATEKKKVAEIEVEECRSRMFSQSKLVTSLETSLAVEKQKNLALLRQKESTLDLLELCQNEVKRLKREGATMQTLSLELSLIHI